MHARENSKQLLCGLFYGGTKADMESEGEWMTGTARPVMNPVSLKQLNQIEKKRLPKWYSGEGMGIIGGQGRAI